jgi:hypothetical protein
VNDILHWLGDAFWVAVTVALFGTIAVVAVVAWFSVVEEFLRKRHGP